ncbi:MAG: hypothetical protein JSR31_08990 [Nitrospira sp.]|nr:hypothetical protein [Nitrospira sp.]
MSATTEGQACAVVADIVLRHRTGRSPFSLRLKRCSERLLITVPQAQEDLIPALTSNVTAEYLYLVLRQHY